jgi:AraC-like DNA-binding protein
MDFYFKSAAEKLYMVRNPEGFYQAANMINEEILSIQGVIYSIIILIVLRNYKERVVDFYAGINQSFLRWMRTGVILILIAWTLGIIGTIIERSSINIGVDLFTFVYLFFVLIIYGISYAALRSGEFYKLKTEHISELINIDESHINLSAKLPPGTVAEKTSRDKDLSVKEEEFENELNERLLAFMEDFKPYLNPDLSLQSLAKDLSVSRHQLSATINSRQKMNFFEFVNFYRVNEVKELMKKDRAAKDKNYELAYEAGFNSKATFYRIFKKFSGQTPSAFRARINEGDKSDTQ